MTFLLIFPSLHAIIILYIHVTGKEVSDMDIASLSTSLSMANVQNDFGVLMLSKQLDTVEDMGDSMIKLMEQSVNPHLGGNIDISV